MGISAFQRQRRLAAEAKGLPAGTFVPLNYTAAHEVAQQNPRENQLLETLNNAEEPDDLTVLPTVGQATAKIIFENRPENGYDSVDDAIARNPSVTESPYRVDWQALEDYFTEAS